MVAVRRLLADRTALFFLVVLPIMVILLIGASVGGFRTLRVAVVDQGAGPLGAELVTALEATASLEVGRLDDLDEARTQLRRGVLEGVVVLPAGMTADLQAGRGVEVPVLGEASDTGHLAARAAVAATIAEHGAQVQAATFAAERTGTGLDRALDLAQDQQAAGAAVGVTTEMADAESSFLPDGFGYSAPTMLVLFVFIIGMAGGGALIQSRQLGVHARALAAPVSPGELIAGETVGYLAVTLGQSLLLVGVGALVFGVDWGDPLAAGALVLVWALVAAAAGMLSGTLFRTPEQASSIGPVVGIALGMLGGTMWPLEIVPPVMQVIGRLVPHGWAVDGWIEILSRGGAIGDVAGHLAVLAGFAAVLLALSVTRLRARLIT
jgi:ABC-2 type transport system permease protein